MRPYQSTLLSRDETRTTLVQEPMETDLAVPVAARKKPAKVLLAVQVAEPDEGVQGGNRGDEFATKTIAVPLRRQRSVTLPPWPTSQPGPEITAPAAGQKLVFGRTDQVTYDFYDQERGRPGLPPLAPAE